MTSEYKKYTVKSQKGKGARARLLIDCPYCEKELQAVAYSIHGTGKMCKCGSKLRKGKAYKPVTKEQQQQKMRDAKERWRKKNAAA